MRKYLKAGLTLVLVAGATACIDLDEELVSSLGAGYAGTGQGLTDVTNGIYAAVKGFNQGDTYYAMQQMGTDTWAAADQISAGGAQNWIYLENYNAQYNSLAAFLNPQWQAGYQIIARANVVLDNGPNIPVGAALSQATKNSRLGEAHFLRAWAYFQLVQQYGGLTVNLSSAAGVSTEAVRQSEDSVYKVIISDLNEAISLLPVSQAEFGRATKGASQNLLAKVYLTRAYRDWNAANKQADFQQALTLAQGVISSGTYSLLPIYADLWCGVHRSGAPADPGRQGYCDTLGGSGYSEQNSEVIWSIQFSIDPTQYTNTAVNYYPVVYLSHYDNDDGWAVGMTRTVDDGRPFRRMRPTPFAISLYNETRCGGQPCGQGVDVVDTRFDGSYQTVWFANRNGTNPVGTCPKCTSGALIRGTLITANTQGAATGSDTSLVYLMYQVPDSYRTSKAYRIGVPCTTAPNVDCGLDNDNKGMFGVRHYPSNKKFQDNTRTGGPFDNNGGKDIVYMRLGETYLIAAEAALGVNNTALAAQMINVLRVRAACDPGPANAPKLCATSHKNDPSILVTPAQITLDFIYDERERELGGELMRWDDIRRPGPAFFLQRVKKGNPYAAANVQEKHYFRPIPAQQIQGVTGPAPYPQNPGGDRPDARDGEVAGIHNRARYIRTVPFFIQVHMRVRLAQSAFAILAIAVSGGSQRGAASAQNRIDIAVDASRPGAKIDRNIFGQFAEHLGYGVYEGIWVGPQSPIPNTRGMRNDVVAALKALKVPNVRWPGGCFADDYHWRKGIGAADRRVVTLNPSWGGVIEPNTFGTHEFMDFLDQIGSEAYLSVNVGSGTPQEAAEWLEYMTTAQPTTLAQERAANGQSAPYKVPFLGIGNESWDCGGNFSVDAYLTQLRIYSRFVRNFNTAQSDAQRMQKIAVGPGGGSEPRWVEWTETIMKAWQARQWSWDMDGLSLHYYTVPRWPPTHASVGFGEAEYAQILKTTLRMQDIITTHSAIMDRYDPEKKIALVVDEWGAWYAPLPGSNPAFLVQQNSVRDAILAALNLNIFARHATRVRIANIAQMVNVLQAMIMTDKARMVLTPTYHVFRMYVPFQDATFVPVTYDAGSYTHGEVTLPRVDAIAAKDASGALWLAITNVDPDRPADIEATLSGMTARSATGQTLTGPKVDSVNSFDAPATVEPKPVTAKIQNGRLTVRVAPKSVTVISIRS